ncbi:envelope stress response protein PspG [Aliivibrio kagoshimensis]|jgi:phage shock protein G|uniref:envelope stress response protein PspG n=1 Tax=Aliivibrio kagoshimensis TaxID=2910230 RepID=UPI003D0F8D5E
MLEILFLLGFAFILMFTGVTMISLIAATVVGFIIMLLAGMVGVMLKMLPWIIVIAVGVWFFKHKVSDQKYGR